DPGCGHAPGDEADRVGLSSGEARATA
ncbi:MAG: hypothetical protein JWO56_1706, partial [Acidobacteria bacterium]|nr:hypothetical protein [Acidobacteriota bacterium]